MKINLIVAVNRTNGIGFENKIPWHLPEDLAYFKSVTMGFPVIMGRNTFDSLPAPLRGRKNIVVTSNPFIPNNPELVVVTGSYEEALAKAKEFTSEKVFIIGGISAYQAFWNVADELYLTRVHTFTDQDVVLDLSDLNKKWTLLSKVAKNNDHFEYSHEVYLKKQQDLFN